MALRNQIETLYRVKGNREYIGGALVEADGSALNLTGKTVFLRGVKVDGTLLINDAAAVIDSAPAGLVHYEPTAPDVANVLTAALYWVVREAGKPDRLFPYDGPRWLLVIIEAQPTV